MDTDVVFGVCGGEDVELRFGGGGDGWRGSAFRWCDGGGEWRIFAGSQSSERDVCLTNLRAAVVSRYDVLPDVFEKWFDSL